MGYTKRAMALLLALAMSLCLVFSASAATSPTTAPTTVENVTPIAGTNVANVTGQVAQVGNGSTGAFNTAVKTVFVDTSAPELIIATKAFNGAAVSSVTVNTPSIRIQKNAFKGTKKKNPTIKINGPKTAADVKVVKGSFKGLNKKAKIVVNKQTMTKKQFNKLKKKLKNKGFKGKIVRKKF